jgi:hypothetical protein
MSVTSFVAWSRAAWRCHAASSACRRFRSAITGAEHLHVAGLCHLDALADEFCLLVSKDRLPSLPFGYHGRGELLNAGQPAIVRATHFSSLGFSEASIASMRLESSQMSIVRE